MLLANRRHRLLFLAIAGMDVAWVLPFVLTWIAYTSRHLGTSLAFPYTPLLLDPLILFLVCWATMILYLFIADLLNRLELDTPARELAILGLLLSTSLIAIRLLLYPTAPLSDLYWLAETTSALLNFTTTSSPPLIVLAINAYLWIRVAIATDRGVSFFSVGVTFRLGMLLALLGGLLLTTFGGQPAAIAILAFALFFAFGLLAVALARIDEKAVGAANSTGALLPWARLAQLVASILLFLGMALASTRIINPTALRALIHVFDPLWSAIGWVLMRLLVVVFLLLGPLMERFVAYVQRLAENIEPQPVGEPVGPIEFGTVETAVREWAALRYCLTAGVILFVLLLLLLFFVRTRPRTRTAEPEGVAPEELSVSGGLERLGLGRVREWLNLLRRHGFSRQLLAAVTVQNMYANLGRIARRRGHPRAPAQSPDDYLPALRQAFPGSDAQLLRITLAYMRVHYGDQRISQDELDQLRADYAHALAQPKASSQA